MDNNRKWDCTKLEKWEPEPNEVPAFSEEEVKVMKEAYLQLEKEKEEEVS